ncbi:pyridoxamine 5'-phosphate oxidase family protein [Paenibacillus sp. FSL K6-2524]|uniref:pyridoxamine 5'-phosphate oxidase family protein n=1 Tax=Paenibacillus sp. FSL K6-2524 TaxID=2954516 RepID=UPI0030FA92DD
MAVVWEQKVVELINNKDSVKVLATLDGDGVPHTAVKQSLHVDQEGRIVYLELLESSRTFKNITLSLWHDQYVSVTVKDDESSYKIKGKPTRIHICGTLFEEHYIAVRERLGDVDLAAVCVIEPEEVRNQTYHERLAVQEAGQPFYVHLDRLASTVHTVEFSE